MEQWRRLRIIVRQAAYLRNSGCVRRLFIPPQTLPTQKTKRCAMTVRNFFATAVLVGSVLAAPAQAASSRFSPSEQMDLQRVSAYLNSLQSVQGNFVQLAGDGRTARGTVYL